MLNLKELEESLDKALASETPESIAAWVNEKVTEREKDQGLHRSSYKKTNRVKISKHNPMQAG